MCYLLDPQEPPQMNRRALAEMDKMVPIAHRRLVKAAVARIRVFPRRTRQNNRV
jgi:hypothetical protein